MYPDTTASITDTMRTLAYIGDLSMGQPTEHSLRTAWLAARIAAALGRGQEHCVTVQQVAMLRWSSCTANAADFDEIAGDDIASRADMLSHDKDPAFAQAAERIHKDVQRLTGIHCEVSAEIATLLRVPVEVQRALQGIFATYDGSGPSHLHDGAVPDSVYVVALASDVEIVTREQGLSRALEVIARKSGKAYPGELATVVQRQAKGWLEELDQNEDWQAPLDFEACGRGESVALELLADVIDLKLPWMTGYSRRVAQAAYDGARAMDLDADAQLRCYRAALVHGIGRAAVPNAVWNTVGKLSVGAREQLRLAPYWTSRAAARIGGLGSDADIGSYAGERLNGSGAFRACRSTAIPQEGKIVAAAQAWVALRSMRPWRAAMSADEACAVLNTDVASGRFDADVVRAVTGAVRPPPEAGDKLLLTEREIDVFRRISLGLTNKEVARELAISPSTVRTHVENVFRKLGCGSRAAATLKASTLRLL